MTNKFIKQYNYAEMSVLNVKSIKVTNGTGTGTSPNFTGTGTRADRNQNSGRVL